MASQPAPRLLVELAAHSIQLALVDAGGRLVGFKQCAVEPGAVAAALAELSAGGSATDVKAVLMPSESFVLRSNSEEAASMRTAKTLLARAESAASALDSPLSVVAFDGATGLRVDTVGSAPWVLVGTPTARIDAAKDQLTSLGLPSVSSLRLSLPVRLGAVVTALQDMPESTRVLIWQIGESDAQLACVSAGGCEAAGVAGVGFAQIFEAVQAGLGLKFRAAATKLFFNNDYDFSETAGPVAERIAALLRPAIASLGCTPTALHVAGLPAGQTWLANAVASALEIQPLTVDVGAFCAQRGLTGDAVNSGLPTSALGLLYQASAGDDTNRPWQPDWLDANAPVVVAPPAPAPAPKPPVAPAPVAPAPADAAPAPAPAPVVKTPVAPKPAPVAAPKPVAAPAPVAPAVAAAASAAASAPAPAVIPPPAKAVPVAQAPAPAATAVKAEPVAKPAAPTPTPAPAAKPITPAPVIKPAAAAPAPVAPAPLPKAKPAPVVTEVPAVQPAPAPVQAAQKKKPVMLFAAIGAAVVLGGVAALFMGGGDSSKSGGSSAEMSQAQQRLREEEMARMLAEELKTPRSFRNDRYSFEVSDRGLLRKLVGVGNRTIIDEFGWLELQGMFTGTAKPFSAGTMNDNEYVPSINKTIRDGNVVFEIKGTHPRFTIETLVTCLPTTLRVHTVFRPVDMKDARGALSGVYMVKINRQSLSLGQRAEVTPGSVTYSTQSGPLVMKFNEENWGQAGEAGKQTVMVGSNLVFFYFAGTADAKSNVLTTELTLP